MIAIKPKISIVLSNFNGGDLLKHTIQSVIDQTFKDWELIFIDDCSTDHSREIMGSFRDERIKVTYFKKNQHMCYAFNYGISVSGGKYIARIDSDDTWLPDKLEKQYAFMEGHHDYGACFTWVNVVDEYDNILTESQSDRVDAFKAQNRDQYGWIRFLYFNGPCLCHPTVLMRKDVLDEVGVYNYSLVQLQDYDLWIRIVKKYPIYVITEKLANYRWFTTGENASAYTNTVITRSYFETAYVLSKYFDDLPDEVFIKAFGEDFVIKGSTDARHLECEKMLLLIKPAYGGNVQRIGGMRKFMDLLECNETREILLREYGITQKYFYELSGFPILYNPYNFESGIIPPPVVLDACVKPQPSEPGLDLDAIPRKVLLKKLVSRTFSKHKILYSALRKIYRFIFN